MEEIWIDIKDFEGLYQISNLGRVKSLGNDKKRKEKILKERKTTWGYLRVTLYKNGKKIKSPFVHVLVAQAFIPNPENKSDVHHIDHNKQNNCAENLMWVTVKEHGDLHTEWIWQKKSKSVLQIDKDTNEVIAEYPSAMEAERQTEIFHQNIISCCRGKYKSTGGYKWKYKS